MQFTLRNMDSNLTISVIGANKTILGIYHLAEQVGTELAKNKAIVVYGGHCSIWWARWSNGSSL